MGVYGGSEQLLGLARKHLSLIFAADMLFWIIAVDECSVRDVQYLPTSAHHIIAP